MESWLSRARFDRKIAVSTMVLVVLFFSVLHAQNGEGGEDVGLLVRTVP